jgi:CDP-diacylglycerol--glycerol-3-phosphate 3-phosphatidyltransferase
VNRRGRFLSHIPNLLTALRLVLACVFVALLPGFFRTGTRLATVMAVFCAICATDLVDGVLARALGAVSALGAVLDLWADLFYVVSSLVVLNRLGQVPAWFTAIVIVKFIEFWITSRVLRDCEECRAGLVSDSLGRCAAALYLLIPGIICALYAMPRWNYHAAVHGVLIVAVVLTVWSSAMRCSCCVKAVSIHRATRRGF